MKTLGLGLGLGNVRLLGPDQISNLQLRVRSDAKAVSGSTLTGLTDLSGNSQTIAVAGSPSIVAADCNGFDAMSFSGTSDKFSASFTQAFPVSYALVLEIPSPGAGGTHDVVCDGTNAAGLTACFVADSTPEYYAYAGSLVGPVASNPFATKYKCVIAVFNGASSAVYVNGTQTASGNDTQSRGNPGGFVYGLSGAGTRGCPSKLVEGCVYNKAMSPTDIALFNAYAIARYALT